MLNNIRKQYSHFLIFIGYKIYMWVFGIHYVCIVSIWYPIWNSYIVYTIWVQNMYFGTLVEYKVNTFCIRLNFAEYHGKYTSGANEYISSANEYICTSQAFAVNKRDDLIVLKAHIALTTVPVYSIELIFRRDIFLFFTRTCTAHILLAMTV